MKANKFFSFLIRLNPFLYILLFVAFNYTISHITFFFPTEASIGSDVLTNSFREIAFGIIIGPMIETLLFQALIISLICKFIKRPKYNLYLSLLISATVFSLDHTYNIYYVAYAFLIGISYAFAYYIGRYKKWNAALTVFLIHAIHNTIAIYF